MRYFYALFFIFFLAKAHAYSNFIGHGYTSCLNCHYNPTGGGPLNDYGRVVSATLISSGALYPKKWNEERVANSSGFLFKKPTQNWFRTQINYRGFQIVNNPGSTDKEEKRWINMQLDGRVILKGGENDKFLFVGDYGYAPHPTSLPPGKEQSEWRSREHFLGYRITPKFGLYAGLMDKVYGIKVIEHIAYSRVSPQVTQNDQVHGLVAHYLGEAWETSAQLSAGNLFQDADIRAKGASLMTERTIFDIHRVGASVINSKNDYFDLTSVAVHSRLNLKEGSAILAELGQTKRKTKNQTDDRTEQYGLLQTYLRPFRGLYFFTNIEYYKQNTKEAPYTIRWGPGVQYFPIQRMEFRFDIYNTRSFDPEASSYDSWVYLLQTHIWL